MRNSATISPYSLFRRLAAVLISGLGIAGGDAFALNRFAVADGAWDVASTWSASSGGASGATVPTASDDVSIGETLTPRAVSIPAGVAALANSVTLATAGGVNGAKSLTLSASTSSLEVTGNLTINKPANANINLLNVNAGTVTVHGNLTLGGATATATQIARIVLTTGTVNVDGNLVFVSGSAANNNIDMTSSSGTINLKGAFTATLGTTQNLGSSVFNYNGAAAQTVLIGVSAINYRNLHLNNANAAGAAFGAAVTAANVTGNIRVQTGILNNGGFAIVNAGGANVFEVANGARFNLSGASTMVSGFTADPAHRTFGATSTVNYQGGAQAVSAETYGHLILDGGSTKTPTAGATAVVAGNFTLGAGTTFAGTTNNYTFAGNFTNSGTFTSGTGTYTFNGTNAVTPQVLTGAATFTNMTVNNTGIGLQLASDVTVSTAAAGGLILTDGNIDTQGNNLIISRACNVSATVPVNRSAGTAGWIIGNLRKTYPTGTPVTCGFEVGDASNFTPITLLTITSVTTSGTLTARTTTGEHADTTANTSGIDASNSVNRTWTLTSGGALAFVGNSYSATFNFINAGDLDASPVQANFIVARKVGGEWTYPNTSSALAASTTATGIPEVGGFGEFAIGAPKVLAAFGEWRMDDTTWKDSSVNGFNGTGAGLAGAVPTGASTTPAVPGNPGTCAYGVFNRANKTYIALPGTFPNLGASNGFTITAWIRTTDNTQPGQRIFLDDEGITGGGYGFSLGDGGTGILRFFSRGTPSALILDTPNVIANNTWFFVAAVVDIKNRTKRIYVYNTAGALVAGTPVSASWTEASFGSDTGIASIGGETNSPPNVGEGTSSFGFAGNLDEVRVYQSAWSQQHVNLVRQLTRGCFDHYQISHSGTGINCQPENVTITAHDASHAPVAAGSTITVTARRVGGAAGNHGDWSLPPPPGTGVLNNGTADDGVATYAFGAGESSVVLGLKDTFVQTVNIDVLDGSAITESTGAGGSHADANLNFVQAGFKFTSPIATQIAGTTSVSYDLQAIRTDLQTGACAAAFNGLVTNIDLASECVNPATCQAGQQVNFINNGSGLIAANPAGAPSSYTTRTLNFGASSTAQFTFDYPDAGAIRLHARYNIPLGGGGASGNLMTGATDVAGFVVKPSTFKVTGIKRTSDNFANPGAADATGSVFIKAGDDITLTVRSENSLGNLTPNFGKETPTPQGVTLTANLVAPSPGNNPGLGNPAIAGGSFSGGQATVANVTWGEVGIVTLTPAVTGGSYLGAGSVAGTTTGNVGRFTPFDFAVTFPAPPPQFTTACAAGNFSYIGQLFGYATAPVLTVTARNKAAGTTLNYKGTAPAASAFFKLTNASLTPATQALRYSAATGTLDVSALPLTGADPAIVANGNGTGTLTFSSGGSGIAFNRNTPLAPFNADIALAINVIDTDAIAFAGNPASFGTATATNGIGFSTSKEMRFGRLRMQNALGSEKLVLPVAVETQYWNGSAFARNAQDSCTTLAKSTLSLTGYVPNLAACETTVNQATVSFIAGLGTLTLSPAGAGNSGSVLVTANLGAGAGGNNFCPASPGAESPATGASKSYLQGAWTGAIWNENPSARATFGLFGGQPKNFIFFRENY